MYSMNSLFCLKNHLYFSRDGSGIGFWLKFISILNEFFYFFYWVKKESASAPKKFLLEHRLINSLLLKKPLMLSISNLGNPTSGRQFNLCKKLTSCCFTNTFITQKQFYNLVVGSGLQSFA